MSGKKEKLARKENPIRDYTKEQNDRCMPVAIKIMQVMIAKGTLPENTLSTKVEKDDMYFEMMKEIHPILMEGNIDFEKDMEYISQMIGSSLYVLVEAIKGSLNKNLDYLRNSIFNLDDNTDEIITVKMLSDAVVRRKQIREAVTKIIAEPYTE